MVCAGGLRVWLSFYSREERRTRALGGTYNNHLFLDNGDPHSIATLMNYDYVKADSPGQAQPFASYVLMRIIRWLGQASSACEGHG